MNPNYTLHFERCSFRHKNKGTLPPIMGFLLTRLAVIFIRLILNSFYLCEHVIDIDASMYELMRTVYYNGFIEACKAFLLFRSGIPSGLLKQAGRNRYPTHRRTYDEEKNHTSDSRFIFDFYYTCGLTTLDEVVYNSIFSFASQ